MRLLLMLLFVSPRAFAERDLLKILNLSNGPSRKCENMFVSAHSIQVLINELVTKYELTDVHGVQRFTRLLALSRAFAHSEIRLRREQPSEFNLPNSLMELVQGDKKILTAEQGPPELVFLVLMGDAENDLSLIRALFPRFPQLAVPLLIRSYVEDLQLEPLTEHVNW